MKKIILSLALGVSILGATLLSACAPTTQTPPPPPNEPKAYLEQLDDKATEMKNAVLNTDSDYECTGVEYYVSQSGSASNDGLSEDTPITLEKLQSLTLQRGDAVLFKRGDLFRTQRIATQAGVTYSAYGTGRKPIICGSLKDYGDAALWEETDVENVYHLKEKVDNVGIIMFNHTFELGSYDATLGDKRIAGWDMDKFKWFDTTAGADNSNVFGVDASGNIIDNVYSRLDADLEYYSDMDTGDLYVYSEQNPGERFSNIEIGGDAILLAGSMEDVVIDNLHVTLSGGHGINSGRAENLTVRNCVFDWIGGSILRGYDPSNVPPSCQYGNAIEIFGSCDGYYVYNNWIYQIYDTAITHQYNQGALVNNMIDTEYYDNLVEYCHIAVEIWNSAQFTGGDQTQYERIIQDNYVYNNFFRYTGYGWGTVGRYAREWNARTLSISPATQTEVESLEVYNNIFQDSSYLQHYFGTHTDAHERVTRYNNTYVHKIDTRFIQINVKDRYFGEECEDSTERPRDKYDAQYILENSGEIDFTIVFIYEDGTTSMDVDGDATGSVKKNS